MKFQSLLSLALLAIAFQPSAKAEVSLNTLGISEFHCLTSTGIRIDGKEAAKANTRDQALDVNTNWFGLNKPFQGTFFFSVKPRGEVTITLDGDDKFFFLRLNVDPETTEVQNAGGRLEQSGMAGFQSPGEHLFLATASCTVRLKRLNF